MGFPKQEYWSVLPIPSPGDLTDPGIEPEFPALAGISLPPSHRRSPIYHILDIIQSIGVLWWIKQTRSLLSWKLHSTRGDRLKAMAPHSSALAWKIPWTEEPGRLQSMGSLESDTTKRLHFHFSLSCIGAGSGNPLQCSCLENPRDGGARWATVYGVAQSRAWLKWLSSSSIH